MNNLYTLLTTGYRFLTAGNSPLFFILYLSRQFLLLKIYSCLLDFPEGQFLAASQPAQALPIVIASNSLYRDGGLQWS